MKSTICFLISGLSIVMASRSTFAQTHTSNPDAIVITWVVGMSRSISVGGFAFGDTAFVRYNIRPCTDSSAVEKRLIRIGHSASYTAKETVSVPLGTRLYYRYCVQKRGSVICELIPYSSFCEREVVLSSSQINISDTANCNTFFGCMPLILDTRPLTRSVYVRWEVDLRPAWYQVAAGDTLPDIQGNRHIKHRDSVLTSGVWINGPATGGWQTWGAVLARDTSRQMFDDGTHGDRVAGDSIFTRVILASPDSLGIGTKGQRTQVFKFSIKGGDNEGGFGNHHMAAISDSDSVYTMREQWGSIAPAFYRCWDYLLRQPRNCVTAIVPLPDIPHAYALSQNYSNPFNSSTTISYAIPARTHVLLTVYDVLGREVMSLIDGMKDAGLHSVSVNATNLPSGVYLYRMQAGSFSDVKKFVTVK